MLEPLAVVVVVAAVVSWAMETEGIAMAARKATRVAIRPIFIRAIAQTLRGPKPSGREIGVKLGRD
jgi:hypothetical protein